MKVAKTAVTAADTRGPPREFARSSDWLWLWDIYVGGGCAGTIALVFVLDDQYPGNRFGASAAVAGMVIWAATFGRNVMAERAYTWRAWLFMAGVVALLTAALLCSPISLTALPAMYPLAFMSLPLPGALAVTSLVNLLPVAVVGVRDGVNTSAFTTATGLALLAFVFTPMIGTWITRTAEQNRERAVLLEELMASRAEVARLSHDAGTAAERARLAREIHDTLAQGFTSIATLTQAVESEINTDPRAARRHIALIRTTARDNLAEARAMVTALTPSALSAGSLVESIRRQGGRLSDETGIAVTVTAGSAPPGLSKAGEVVLLRAVQEAFANVRKHAQASAVTVEISGTGGEVRLVVTDDGIGFGDHCGDDGFGLRGMRARVEQIGGRMSVRSRPGSGTTLEVEVPA